MPSTATPVGWLAAHVSGALGGTEEEACSARLEGWAICAMLAWCMPGLAPTRSVLRGRELAELGTPLALPLPPALDPIWENTSSGL